VRVRVGEAVKVGVAGGEADAGAEGVGVEEVRRRASTVAVMESVGEREAVALGEGVAVGVKEALAHAESVARAEVVGVAQGEAERVAGIEFVGDSVREGREERAPEALVLEVKVGETLGQAEAGALGEPVGEEVRVASRVMVEVGVRVGVKVEVMEAVLQAETEGPLVAVPEGSTVVDTVEDALVEGALAVACAVRVGLLEAEVEAEGVLLRVTARGVGVDELHADAVPLALGLPVMVGLVDAVELTLEQGVGVRVLTTEAVPLQEMEGEVLPVEDGDAEVVEFALPLGLRLEEGLEEPEELCDSPPTGWAARRARRKILLIDKAARIMASRWGFHAFFYIE
jgi:hypothetical protein